MVGKFVILFALILVNLEAKPAFDFFHPIRMEHKMETFRRYLHKGKPYPSQKPRSKPKPTTQKWPEFAPYIEY
ncbi:unnamed protein product [Bursaphelenchus xylophilus]|uniref:(pine wood nematode) hypothetical protein n=1 Tax=Bursaphelenchus xylophilus TaxID=6326 RepID=A0A1I7RUC4_BURXY|nr:unnamed protein product [Bursaphelenchus xylophilus]CAG9114026.1 unnamed protein product [Bursaphelenchus xylophilus]